MAELNGENALAVRLFEDVYAAEPTSATIAALAEHQLKMGLAKKALERLRGWVAKNGDDVVARHLLAKTFAALEMPTQQIGEYREILKIASDDVIALNNLAWALLSPHQVRRWYMHNVPATWRRIPARFPTLSPWLCSTTVKMSWHLKTSGDRALPELHPNNNSASLFFHRAVILHSMRRSDEVRETLQKLLGAVQDFADRKDAEQLLASLV